jgi:hypothetical protein
LTTGQVQLVGVLRLRAKAQLTNLLQGQPWLHRDGEGRVGAEAQELLRFKQQLAALPYTSKTTAVSGSN